MSAATTERERLYTLIDSLPDDKLSPVIAYVMDYLDETPNAETLEALEDIEAGRNIIGPFNDVDSLFNALLRDDDE